MDHKDLCEHTKIRLIAAAIGHQQCTKTAANVIPLPGTDRVITIGTRGEVARLLAGSAAEQPTGDLPPLPLDLDNTNPRISMHVKAGDLVTQLHRWGREVYLAGQSQATSTVSAPEEVRARVWDAVAGALDGVYYCNRVWSAWGVGTMSEDDFTPASEDDDILDNVVNVVFEALRTTSGKGEAE